MLIKPFDILVILDIPIGNSEVFLEFKSFRNCWSLNILEVNYREQTKMQQNGSAQNYKISPQDLKSCEERQIKTCWLCNNMTY
jgi:hypothetical protein